MLSSLIVRVVEETSFEMNSMYRCGLFGLLMMVIVGASESSNPQEYDGRSMLQDFRNRFMSYEHIEIDECPLKYLRTVYTDFCHVALIKKNASTCLGVLVNDYYILSTAECVPEDWKSVHVQLHNEFDLPIADRIVYADYKSLNVSREKAPILLRINGTTDFSIPSENTAACLWPADNLISYSKVQDIAYDSNLNRLIQNMTVCSASMQEVCLNKTFTQWCERNPTGSLLQIRDLDKYSMHPMVVGLFCNEQQQLVPVSRYADWIRDVIARDRILFAIPDAGLGEKCITKNDKEGVCLRIEACPRVLKQLKSTARQLTALDQCGFEGEHVLNCCTLDDMLKGEDKREKLQSITQEIEHCHELYDVYRRTTKEQQLHSQLALIRNEASKVECVGTLISKQFVLTAAQCVLRIKSKSSTVLLGVAAFDPKETQILNVVSTVIHPMFDHQTNHYNIALLTLEAPIAITEHSVPACMWPDKDRMPANLISTGYDTAANAVTVNNVNPLYYMDCRLKYYSNLTLTEACVLPDTNIVYCDEQPTACAESGTGLYGTVYMSSDWRPVNYVVGIYSIGAQCAQTSATLFPSRVPELESLPELMPNVERSVKDCPFTIYNHGGIALASSIFVDRYVDKTFSHTVRVLQQDITCVGLIVDENHVLTTSECASPEGDSLPEIKFANETLDAINVAEMFPHVEYNVSLLRLNSSIDDSYQVEMAQPNTYYPRRDNEIRVRTVAQKVHYHPEFDAATLANDIALLELVKPIFDFNETVLPACIWTRDKFPVEMFQTNGYAPFNETDDDGTVRTKQFYATADVYEECVEEVPPNQFCAGFPTALAPKSCHNNIGSAMSHSLYTFNRYFEYIFAINSKGENCGFNMPTVYTKIAPYVNWIDSIIFAAKVHYEDDTKYYGDRCQDANGMDGSCVSLRYCPKLDQEAKQGNAVSPSSSCSFGKQEEMVVCCLDENLLRDETHSNQLAQVMEEIDNCQNLYHEFRKNKSPYTIDNFPTYPFLARIHGKDGRSCNGTLIAKQFVLTTASCFESMAQDEISIVLGNMTRQQMAVQRTFTHPEFHKVSTEFNMLLLKLASPVTINNETIPACLWNNQTFTPLRLQEVYANPNYTHQYTFPLFNENCLRKYQDSNVTCLQLCVEPDNMFYYRHDFLGDDSGSALVSHFAQGVNEYQVTYLVGLHGAGRVVTRNVTMNDDEKPPSKKYYHIYQRISEYYNWIRNVITVEVQSS
uniref:Peptidase S1 domain-containing protein n=1 Tax=Anopheles minimus TaxID=112268 RepID=A0A182W2Y7_9DIPT